MQSSLFSGDLPSLHDQAVVTAVNEALRGGGGVHSRGYWAAGYWAAGPELAAPYWAACFLPGRRRANAPWVLSCCVARHPCGRHKNEIASDKSTSKSDHVLSFSIAAMFLVLRPLERT